MEVAKAKKELEALFNYLADDSENQQKNFAFEAATSDIDDEPTTATATNDSTFAREFAILLKKMGDDYNEFKITVNKNKAKTREALKKNDMQRFGEIVDDAVKGAVGVKASHVYKTVEALGAICKTVPVDLMQSFRSMAIKFAVSRGLDSDVAQIGGLNNLTA